MKLYQILTILVLTTGSAFLFFQNCEGGRFRNEKGQIRDFNREKAELLDFIQSLNMRNLTCSSDHDCFVIPLGEKLCGGPESLLVSSHLNPDTEEIQRLAKQFTEVSRDMNQGVEIVGDCSTVSEVSFVCDQGLCQ